MPPGVPVATVGLDNAKNAGILAAQILATADDELKQKIIGYKAGLKDQVQSMVNDVENDGWRNLIKK